MEAWIGTTVLTQQAYIHCCAVSTWFCGKGNGMEVVRRQECIPNLKTSMISTSAVMIAVWYGVQTPQEL